jgi:raffinose/stachyose/melibiose transport system permease protein
MRSVSSSRRIANAFKYLLCAFVVLIIAVPLWISVMGGFKSVGQLRADPVGLPQPFDTSQYAGMLSGKLGKFWIMLLNSVILAAGTVGVVLVLATFSGFALARIKFKLNKAIYSYFQLGFFFPLAVAILPLYLQLRKMGLLDKYWGVILPQAAFGLMMMIMLLRGFFKAIPNELEEAAAIDGYGRFGFLFKIVVPLSTPILATVSVLTLVNSSWNNFFTPLLVFSSEKKYPLPLGVMNFMGQYAADWNRILAFLTLAMVPAIIIYIFCQKYIVAGLTGGAIKG